MSVAITLTVGSTCPVSEGRECAIVIAIIPDPVPISATTTGFGWLYYL